MQPWRVRVQRTITAGLENAVVPSAHPSRAATPGEKPPRCVRAETTGEPNAAVGELDDGRRRLLPVDALAGGDRDLLAHPSILRVAPLRPARSASPGSAAASVGGWAADDVRPQVASASPERPASRAALTALTALTP